MTTVIHIKDAPPGWELNQKYVYIGRAGHGFDGKYGNPHPVGYCSLCKVYHGRGEAILAFKIDAEERYKSDAEYRKDIEFLRDKILVCFCKPRDCHGDVYVEMLNRRK